MKRSYPRLTQPLVRENGSLRPAGLDEAVERAVEGLSPYRGESFVQATNETNYIAQKFARVVMGSNNIDSCNRT